MKLDVLFNDGRYDEEIDKIRIIVPKEGEPTLWVHLRKGQTYTFKLELKEFY